MLSFNRLYVHLTINAHNNSEWQEYMNGLNQRSASTRHLTKIFLTAANKILLTALVIRVMNLVKLLNRDASYNKIIEKENVY